MAMIDDRRDVLDIDDDRPTRFDLAGDDLGELPRAECPGQEMFDFGPDFDPDPF